MRYIKVRVFPESSEEKVEEIKPDTYRVYVKDSAKRGAANRAMLYLLFLYFHKKHIRIQSGHTTPNKIIVIID